MPLSIHPSVCLSITLSPIKPLELNQTCYMTSPGGKGVQENIIFHPAPCDESITLSPPEPQGRT